MKNIIVALVLSSLSVIALAATQDDSLDTAPMVTTKIRRLEAPSTSVVSRVVPQFSLMSATYVGDDTDAVNATTGFSAGATVDIGRTQFVFETGLLYRQFGATLNAVFGTVTYHNAYLAVPLLAKYYVSEVGSTVYFKGGLVPQFLVYKNASATVFGTNVSTNNIPFSNFDLDGAIGFGGKIALTDTNDLFLELAYNRSFTSIDNSSFATNLYNSAFIFTAGAGFDL